MPNDVLEQLLMGEGSRDQAMQKALSGGLRRRAEIGELAQLTGDRVLQPFGQNLSQRTQRQGEVELGRRDKASQRDLTQSYYDQQASQSALQNTMMKQRMEETERHNRAMELGSEMRASGLGKVPPSNAQKISTEKIANYSNIDNLSKSFIDDYGSSVGFGEGSISNVLGKTPLSSQGQKDQAHWWAEFDRLYTLPVRNEMFGSALTDTEKAAWDQANVGPNMPPAVIRKGMESMKRIARDVARRQMASDQVIYNSTWVDTVYGEIDLSGGAGTRQSAPVEQVPVEGVPGADGSGPIKVDWGNMP